MLKKYFKNKASKDRIRKAVEHQDMQRGQAEARARAQDMLKRMEDKKRAAAKNNRKSKPPIFQNSFKTGRSDG